MGKTSRPVTAASREVSPTSPTAARSGHQALLEEITGSGAWLRLIWDSAPDAMVLSDPEGIVLLANQAYCDLYGFPPDEVLGQSFAIIFATEDRAWAVEQYQAVYAGVDPA